MANYCHITEDMEGLRLECIKGDYHKYLPEDILVHDELEESINDFVDHILEYHREYLD